MDRRRGSHGRGGGDPQTSCTEQHYWIPKFIKCGGKGHESIDCKRPRSPSVVDKDEGTRRRVAPRQQAPRRTHQPPPHQQAPRRGPSSLTVATGASRPAYTCSEVARRRRRRPAWPLFSWIRGALRSYPDPLPPSRRREHLYPHSLGWHGRHGSRAPTRRGGDDYRLTFSCRPG
jgi:hypothetical protein